MIYRLSIFFLLTGFSATAQEPVNVDSIFREAQKKAYSKEYQDSRKLSHYILSISPEYVDAAILIGRTYAWQKQYDSARVILEKILQENPQFDVYYGLAQVEYWSENTNKSLIYANQGVNLDSANIELLLLKAGILLQLEKSEEAIKVLNDILTLNKNNTTATKLLGELKRTQMTNEVMAGYNSTSFSRSSTVRHLFSLEYLYKNPKTKYIGRLSYVNQQVWQSIQAEIEGYFSLKENSNLFLSAGVSDGNFFPDYRVGAEAFYLLPHKIETSIGVKTLFFSDDAIFIFTGQIGKYIKSNWISARVFLQDENNDIQITGVVQFRHYLKNSDNYISLMVSKGSMPSIPFGRDEIYRLDAISAGIKGQFAIRYNLMISGFLAYEHEEYIIEMHRGRINTGISIMTRF